MLLISLSPYVFICCVSFFRFVFFWLLVSITSVTQFGAFFLSVHVY